MRRFEGRALLLMLFVLAGCAADSEPVGLEVYRQRLDSLKTRDFFQSIEVTDRNGIPLATVAPDGQRIWIPLDEVPDVLKKAVIATEDQTFYSNTGVDPSALARAALQNAQAGETVSGASTITMQLVRLVAFDDEERYAQTLERKVREAHLAAEINEQYSKEEILEAYLNIAYFGHRAYGIEAAGRVYFGKSARELNLEESTLLAGLPQAPAVLDPFLNPEGARERQRVVLQRMVDIGELTQSEASNALNSPLSLVTEAADDARRARHFVDYVLAGLPEILGEDVARRGGFTVTTTLDLAFNERVEQITRDHVATIAERHEVSDASVVAVRPESGEIVAMVGGVDYDRPGNGQVNVNVRRRQPGSAFKPIVYAAAFESGWLPASLVWDIPYQYPDGSGGAYTPTNYDGRYRGPLRLRSALGNSLNAATIGLAADVGLPAIFDMANGLGLNLEGGPDAHGLSVALGAAEVRLLDLTGAYGAFANEGVYTEPRAVLAVESFRGGELLHVGSATRRQVMQPSSAFFVSSILSDPEARQLAFGAGGPLNVSQTAAVKTGTSNDFRDNLTVGYTPYLAVGVWAGNKDGRPMRDVLGITGAAPIWHDVMEIVFAEPHNLPWLSDGSTPSATFSTPENVVAAEICELPSLGVDGSCRQVTEYFPSESSQEIAFDWFRVRAAAGGGQCSEHADWGSSGGQVFLAPPADPTVAGQVRSWATARGIQVAPPVCPERTASVAADAVTSP